MLERKLNEKIERQGFDMKEVVFLDEVDSLIFEKTLFISKTDSLNLKNRRIMQAIVSAEVCPHDLRNAPESTRRKFTEIAKRKTAEELVPICRLVKEYQNGARTLHDMACALEIDEYYLAETLRLYDSVYGEKKLTDGSIVKFLPFDIITL